MAPKTAKSTSAARRKARAASAERADKSLDQFRSALERSLTLSRERIEEVMDDAVKRGRMTRDDANELVSRLVDRGRKQSEDMLVEIESALKQLRDEIQSRAEWARDAAQEMIERAGVRPEKKRAAKARPAAKKPAAKPRAKRPATKTGAKKKSAPAAASPIRNYEALSAADARKAIAGLTPAQLRTVRAAEKKGKARKTVLADIDKRLAK